MPRYDKEALEDYCSFLFDSWVKAVPSKPEELLLSKVAVFLPAAAEQGTCCSGLVTVGAQKSTGSFRRMSELQD